MLDRIKGMASVVKRHPEVGWFFLLALLVMGPMLLGGYVLTLDMVFTPKLPAPSSVSNTYLFEWLLHILNFFVSGAVVEKLVIFVILLLCGVGMYRLVTTEHEVARYFAGVFYTINPFTYERWMAGQYLVLFGYALLPFLVKALVDLFTVPSRRDALRVLLWSSAIGLVSIHTVVLAHIIVVTMFVVYLLAQKPTKRYYRNMWLAAGAITIGGLILNSYWLLGVITGHSPIVQTIHGIGPSDLSAFTTAYNPHAGLFFNVISLYGFWLERFGRYAMPNHLVAVWYGGFGLISSLILCGVYVQGKARSLLAVSLAIVGFIGLVMALGINAPFTGSFTHWVITRLPLMKGFREPEKFSVLLALAYAYFAGHGLDAVMRRLPAKAEGTREVIRDAALLLPVIYVATMPFGFARQLKPVQYPAAWYSFNQQLLQQSTRGKLLFLPWHEYMSYDFSPRVIANPAPNFFKATVVSGNNAEFGGVHEAVPTADSLFIERQVLTHTTQTQLGHTLARIHIQYVLLSQGYDYQHYGWLSRQNDLTLISHRPGLSVYKNEAYHG